MAKGSPGKRALAKRTTRRTAALAASNPLAPPAFLKGTRDDPGLADALKIWRELATHLHRRNLLDRMDRYAFARWCVYQAEWIEATKLIQVEGISRMVATHAGNQMPRRHPAAMHRDRVELAMGKLEAAYGLTPADRYKVMRDQAAAPLGGLFGPGGRDDDEPDSARPAAPSAADPIGFLADRATPSPGPRPH